MFDLQCCTLEVQKCLVCNGVLWGYKKCSFAMVYFGATKSVWFAMVYFGGTNSALRNFLYLSVELCFRLSGLGRAGETRTSPTWKVA